MVAKFKEWKIARKSVKEFLFCVVLGLVLGWNWGIEYRSSGTASDGILDQCYPRRLLLQRQDFICDETAGSFHRTLCGFERIPLV